MRCFKKQNLTHKRGADLSFCITGDPLLPGLASLLPGLASLLPGLASLLPGTPGTGQRKFQLLPPAPPYHPFPRVKLHTRGNIWNFTVGRHECCDPTGRSVISLAGRYGHSMTLVPGNKFVMFAGWREGELDDTRDMWEFDIATGAWTLLCVGDPDTAGCITTGEPPCVQYSSCATRVLFCYYSVIILFYYLHYESLELRKKNCPQVIRMQNN